MDDKIILKNAVWSGKDASGPISCFYKSYKAYSENYNIHLSNFWEIYILVEGETDRIVEDRCYSMEPYDIIILNPYEPHSHRIKRPGLYERVYFWVPTDAFSFMKSNPMDALIQENGRGNNLICLPPEKKEILKGLLAVFKQEWQKGDRSAELAGFGAFMGVLSLLNEHIEAVVEGEEVAAPTHETMGDIPPVVFDVLRYIENNVSLSLSEEDLAARFHISTSYLSRLFKKHIGQGLKKYMVVRKIGRAKKLLDGGKTVTETCFECGFNDCSYFIKVFKTYTGVTPYKYQILNKNRTTE
jgi:AraC-like DNA-binding protein